MAIDSQADINAEDQAGGATGSPLSQATGGGANTKDLLGKQIQSLEQTRQNKKAILDKAIANLQGRLPQEGAGPSAEELFRIAGALGSPTKTGGFGETLANFAGASGDILKGRRENQQALQDMMMKYQLQGADVDADYLKQTIDATKAMQGGQVQSNYGKIAMDEGLAPGTPEFANRVKQLAQVDVDAKTAKTQGPAAGEFDKKTGNYITGNGAVIKASEISKDREERDAMVKLQESLGGLKKDTIKKAEGWDWTDSDTKKWIAGKFFPKQLSAQVTINASSLQERLKNLPPGPASDKDIAQARSTFPGFGDAKALQEWVNRTETVVNNYISRQDQKYGDDRWYGMSKPGKSSGSKTEGMNRNDLGETPTEQNNMKNSGAVKMPKVGAVLNGYRFNGGDPGQESSWTKV